MRFAPISYTALAVSLLATTPAYAQAADAGAGEIVVTARKREETLISVPVVVSAIGASEIRNRAINNFDGIARAVPQLFIGAQGGSVQGGNIALRGIQGPDSNPFGDQTVSFNIDGVQIAKAMVRKMGSMDIEQVEVLKGPQALFYGKNSPAGIVTLRTADPTKNFQAGISAGYEFEAREIRTDGYVSGPITDTLGFRVAGYFSDMDGYAKSGVPAGTYLADTTRKRSPETRDWAGRLTLKFEPSDKFDARLKLNFNKRTGDGPAATTGYVYCPYGAPQTGGALDCKANGSVTNPGMGQAMVTQYTPNFRKGYNFTDLKQTLGSLEMNYQLGDSVTLTSVTGYYKISLDQASNYENDYHLVLPSNNWLSNEEWSQELRIQTDYDGPINLTGGVYYGSTKATTGSQTFLYYTPDGVGGAAPLIVGGTGAFISSIDLDPGPGVVSLFPGFASKLVGGAVPANTPMQINNYELKQKGKTYSAFAQLSYKPVETVEFNVGGRYTREEKKLPFAVTDPFFRWIDQPVDRNLFPATSLQGQDRAWTDFSPEVTASYRPNQNVTVFASYKHGFLSGGYNSGSIDPTSSDNSYDPMTVKGFEAGIKTLMLDNALRMNLAVYSYKINDMQVQYYVNATNSIANAATGSAKGVEFDFNYRTPLEGLSLRGSAAYNKAKFKKFPGVNCYNGQNAASPNPCTSTDGGITWRQDLSGSPLPRSPKWNLAGGFSFNREITSGMKIGLNGDVTHSSGYITDTPANPYSTQKAYTMLDATLRLAETNDTWELAFIGRNLTNKWIIAASTDVPFTGGPAGSGVLGDRFASVGRGRELMLRVSYKFGN